MSDGGGAYNPYFGRLNTGKMKIRGVMARKGDTPGYVNKMQQEGFEVLARGEELGGAEKDRTQSSTGL
jgi:DNA polymerase, archaea type